MNIQATSCDGVRLVFMINPSQYLLCNRVTKKFRRFPRICFRYIAFSLPSNYSCWFINDWMHPLETRYCLAVGSSGWASYALVSWMTHFLPFLLTLLYLEFDLISSFILSTEGQTPFQSNDIVFFCPILFDVTCKQCPWTACPEECRLMFGVCSGSRSCLSHWVIVWVKHFLVGWTRKKWASIRLQIKFL